jgi:DNA-binding LytR/AlgR family response regulator
MIGSPGKLRTLVVDDEPLARRNLVILLRADPQIEVIESGSGADAIAQVRSHRPDLLFLDVQMPECDGFDVLEMLGPDLPHAVVFVTAYDQYALRAFEAGRSITCSSPSMTRASNSPWSERNKRLRQFECRRRQRRDSSESR